MNSKPTKRKQIGNMSLMAAILIISSLEWHFYSWYTVMNRYGTLITFAALLVTFFCYVEIKDALRDPYFYLMAAADLTALVNLFVIGSNKGAILVVTDLMLFLYLADKLVFSDREIYISLGYTAFFFFYWTVDVKGYFKGYNINYGGLILLTGFVCFMILMVYMRQYVQGHKKLWPRILYMAAFLFTTALAFNIIAWYRSRTALTGLIVFIALMLLPKKIWGNRAVYTAVVMMTTIGSVLISGLYVLIGEKLGESGVRIFNKDLISGREEVWDELFRAFLKKPVTGIGSSFVSSFDYINGIEVHNGLLDILIVHGLIVFAVMIVFLIKKLLPLRETVAGDDIAKFSFAAMGSMLVASMFENYIIVPPFMIMFFMLFAVINNRADRLKTAEGSIKE